MYDAKKGYELAKEYYARYGIDVDKAIKIADETAVPAGQALPVDREAYAEKVTEIIKQNPLIEIYNEEVTDVEQIAKD